MIKMKNFWSLLAIMMVAMVSFGLSSCSSDGDDNNGGGGSGQKEHSVQNLVGVWKLVHVVGHEGSKTADLSESELSYESKRRVTIYADGTYLEEDQKSDNVNWRKRSKGTFRASGETLYVTKLGYYSKSGTEYIYNEYSVPEISTKIIKSLTSTQLVLYEKDDSEDYEATLTFQRVGDANNTNTSEESDYLASIVGQWCYLKTGKAQSSDGELTSVSIYKLTFNSDGTWSMTKRHRLSDDNYVETILGSDFEGTFTLESNNIIAMLNSGNQYATYNFSTEALKQNILRVVVKHDDYSDVENEEYLRYNYSSIDEALEQYIVQNGIRSGNSGGSGNNNNSGTGSTEAQWGKVRGTIKAYGTEYSAVARTANGKSTTVDYVYYPSTGKYYVYGGTWDSNSSANGGKGVRYDAKKGYNSIKINSGAMYDHSTKMTHKWEVYLQVTIP